MEEGKYRKLNMDIIAAKPSKEISSTEALKDIVPIEWSSDVISGRTRAIVDIPREDRACAE